MSGRARISSGPAKNSKVPLSDVTARPISPNPFVNPRRDKRVRALLSFDIFQPVQRFMAAFAVAIRPSVSASRTIAGNARSNAFTPSNCRPTSTAFPRIMARREMAPRLAFQTTPPVGLRRKHTNPVLPQHSTNTQIARPARASRLFIVTHRFWIQSSVDAMRGYRKTFYRKGEARQIKKHSQIIRTRSHETIELSRFPLFSN